MYVLALDESGTHWGAEVLIIAGIAAHEADVRPLERALHAVLTKHLGGLGLDAHKHELHAKELKTPTRAKPATANHGPTKDSEWLTVDPAVRLAVLTGAYATIASHVPADPAFPIRLFGAVVDRRHKQFLTARQYAYDHVLHRFDEMLLRVNKEQPTVQRGIVIHDANSEQERSVQDMAHIWARTGPGLRNLVQVPIFTDSRASRLVQASDFVSWALWRYYSNTPPDDAYASCLWPLVDTNAKNELSGVIHLTPDYGHKGCSCPPCTSRY
jgi:hypothetical protein